MPNDRKVHVEVIHLTTVDSFAHRRRTIERHATIDGMGFSQGIVELIARDGSSEQTNLEGTTCGVLGFGSLGQCLGDDTRRTGRREAAKTERIAILN